MPNRFDLDDPAARRYGTARAIVASLCVLGLASFMWFHGGASPAADESFTAMPGAAADDSLRAPVGDPSLPGLDATFARKDDAVSHGTLTVTAAMVAGVPVVTLVYTPGDGSLPQTAVSNLPPPGNRITLHEKIAAGADHFIA